jgi:hypothetical protein
LSTEVLPFYLLSEPTSSGDGFSNLRITPVFTEAADAPVEPGTGDAPHPADAAKCLKPIGTASILPVCWPSFYLQMLFAILTSE